MTETDRAMPVQELGYWRQEGLHLPRMAVEQVVFLHVVTCGMFSAVWFNLMHGGLPKVRRDDPGPGWAIALLFVPVVNTYWVFFTYLRLVDRIEEQYARHGLPVRTLRPLALAACITVVIPLVNILSFFIIQPAFFAVLQDRINELMDRVASGGGGEGRHGPGGDFAGAGDEGAEGPASSSVLGYCPPAVVNSVWPARWATVVEILALLAWVCVGLAVHSAIYNANRFNSPWHHNDAVAMFTTAGGVLAIAELLIYGINARAMRLRPRLRTRLAIASGALIPALPLAGVVVSMWG